MKLIFICNEFPPRPHGGIGTFVHTIAHGLQQRGHEVTVVGLGEENLDQVTSGIRVVTLRRSKIRYLGNLMSRLYMRTWLSSCVTENGIDLIESPDYMGCLPFGLRECPVVIRLHLTSTSIRRQAGKKESLGVYLYERWTLKANSNWIAVSDYVLGLTKATFGFSPKRSKLVYNPVPEVPSYLPDLPELPRKFVLYASQVSERKGALVLAQAAREFMDGRPDLHLVYVGGEIAANGDRPVPEVIRTIVGPKLANRVHFFGHLSREKVIACMKRASLLAFPSRLEALPLVVLEAMSVGLPVVYTTNPPGPEIVADGANGLLSNPESHTDVAAKIALILDDPELAKRLATNAKETIAAKFSLHRCLDETESFYAECLNSANRPQRTLG